MDVWRRMIARPGRRPGRRAARRPRDSTSSRAPASGVLTRLDAYDVGVAAWRLGAGRARKEDPVQAGAGVELHAKPGDTVTAGQPLLTLHTDTPERFEYALQGARGLLRHRAGGHGVHGHPDRAGPYRLTCGFLLRVNGTGGPPPVPFRPSRWTRDTPTPRANRRRASRPGRTLVAVREETVPPEGCTVEIIDGVITIKPPPTTPTTWRLTNSDGCCAGWSRRTWGYDYRSASLFPTAVVCTSLTWLWCRTLRLRARGTCPGRARRNS